MSKAQQAQDFSALFRPRNVAIVGASASGVSPGNRFIKILSASHFSGNLFVLHPKAGAVDGVKAYQSFEEMPETIDYAFVCVSASAIPDLVRQAKDQVRFMQVMTSGFGETAEGLELNRQLEEVLGDSDMRLLGPNCIGMHSGAAGISFIENTRFEEGTTAIVSQSGGLSIDVLRRGQQMGIAFNSVLSIGNSLDVGAAELLEYHLCNPKVLVVGLYVENVKNGRALFEALRNARAQKPVIILKGGMTDEGSKAAASHTGAIADDERVWKALAAQTGSILVNDLIEFLNLLNLFQTYPPDTSATQSNVVLVGNGGGASVLAADEFARQGISQYVFSDEIEARLATLDVPAGSSLKNPIDVPANALRRNEGQAMFDILDAISDSKGIGALVMHLNLTVFAGYDSDRMVDTAFSALVQLRDKIDPKTKVLFVARADYSLDAVSQSLAFRKKGVEFGIPVFDELADAAAALGALNKLAAFRKRFETVEMTECVA